MKASVFLILACRSIPYEVWIAATFRVRVMPAPAG